MAITLMSFPFVRLRGALNLRFPPSSSNAELLDFPGNASARTSTSAWRLKRPCSRLTPGELMYSNYVQGSSKGHSANQATANCRNGKSHGSVE